METVIRLIDTTFPKEGDYSVVILVDGDEKANIPVSLGFPVPKDEAPNDDAGDTDSSDIEDQES